MLDITLITAPSPSGKVETEIIDIPETLYEELIEWRFFSFSKPVPVYLPDPDYAGEHESLVTLTPSLRSKFIGCLLGLIAKKGISFCTFSLIVPKKSDHEDLLYSIEVLMKLFLAFRGSRFKYVRYS